MSELKPYLDSTPVAGDGPELRRRMERDGYLFIRRLLPADVLEALRLDLLRIARDGGWISRDNTL